MFQRLLMCAVIACPAIAVADAPACPKTITDAALKLVPGGKVTKCSSHTDHFGVHLDKKDGGKIELVLNAKGEVQETEEVVAVSALPAAVSKAFAARYPKIAATKAEDI